MSIQCFFNLYWKNFLFWLSYKLGYPLIAPDMLQLCFTFRCNLRCRMCNVHKKMEESKRKGKPYELTFPLMKNLILQAHNMKIKEVFLVGGEPFIEERIFDLIRYASLLGMRTSVSTNGVLLNEDKISNILDSGLSGITFSIDGSDKETYEEIRGEGIFEKVVSNIKNLILKREKKKSTIPGMNVLCTIMKRNISKLPEMVIFAKRIGVDTISFQPVIPDNTDQSRHVTSDAWIGPEMYNILDNSIDKLVELKNNEFSYFITNSFQHLELAKLYFRKRMPRIRRCYMGYNRLIVSQDHKLYFCVSDPLTGDISFGNVSQTPLHKLWKSEDARRFRKYIKSCKYPCLLYCSYRPEFDRALDKIYSLMKY